jgi:hypothetical protein
MCSQVDMGRATLYIEVLAYRRRTFEWREPPHPFAQRRLPTSADGVATFRSSAVRFHPQVHHHVVRDRIVFPGAGYLETATVAASASSVPAALRGVFFLQPLVVEAGGLLIECALTDGRFEVRSRATDAVEDAVVHCSGALAARDGGEHVDHALLRGGACGRAASVGALYDGFDAVGLQYGPGYRTLVECWEGDGGVAARLRLRSTREGMRVHPADLDDALCAGALVGASDSSATRLPFAVDKTLLQGAPDELWAVRESSFSNGPSPPVSC